MHAGLGIGQDVRQEDALVDLNAVFFRLEQSAFGIDLRPRWCQSRDQLRREVREILDSRKLGEAFRQFAVDRFGVTSQKVFARTAAILEDIGSSHMLFYRPLRFFRQFSQQLCAETPILRGSGSIARVVRRDTRFSFEPRIAGFWLQPSLLQPFFCLVADKFFRVGPPGASHAPLPSLVIARPFSPAIGTSQQ